jgi:hypothetical protein
VIGQEKSCQENRQAEKLHMSILREIIGFSKQNLEEAFSFENR